MTSTSIGRPHGFFPFKPSVLRTADKRRLLPSVTVTVVDSVNDFVRAVPRAVLRDEDAMAIRRRKRISGIEAHPQRRHVGSQQRFGFHVIRTIVASRPEFGIGDAVAVAIRITKMQAGLGRLILSSSAWTVVAQFIAAVVGKPKGFRRRVPIETHGVPNAARHDLASGAVGPDARQRRVDGIFRFANIARRADRERKAIHRDPEGDEFPSVMLAWRIAVGDHDGFGRRF